MTHKIGWLHPANNVPDFQQVILIIDSNDEIWQMFVNREKVEDDHNGDIKYYLAAYDVMYWMPIEWIRDLPILKRDENGKV